MLPTPIKFVDEKLPMPTKAPTVGQHTEQVLRERARVGTTTADRGRPGRGSVRIKPSLRAHIWLDDVYIHLVILI